MPWNSAKNMQTRDKTEVEEEKQSFQLTFCQMLQLSSWSLMSTLTWFVEPNLLILGSEKNNRSSSF